MNLIKKTLLFQTLFLVFLA